RKVAPGDIILLKAASGPVRGVCVAEKTWFYDLSEVPLDLLRQRYAQSICATDDDFWHARENAGYATLIKLQWVRPLTPFICPKRDRRGWVVLNAEREQMELAYSP